MDLANLLNHFREIDSIVDLRGTERLKEIAAGMPTDQQAYAAVVQEFLDLHAENLAQMYDEPFFTTTERLEDILRELYVLDFRAFTALLVGCDRLVDDRENCGFGTGQTAILHSLPPKGFAGITDEQLLRRVETYLSAPAMRHNARGIRQRLLRRSPELVMVPDPYPTT